MKGIKSQSQQKTSTQNIIRVVDLNKNAISYDPDSNYIDCVEDLDEKILAIPRSVITQIHNGFPYITGMSLLSFKGYSLLCFNRTHFQIVDLKNKQIAFSQELDLQGKKFIKKHEKHFYLKLQALAVNKDNTSIILSGKFNTSGRFRSNSYMRMNDPDALNKISTDIFMYDVPQNKFIYLREDYDDRVIYQNGFKDFYYFATIDKNKNVIWVEQVKIKNITVAPKSYKFLICIPLSKRRNYKFIVDIKGKKIFCINWIENQSYNRFAQNTSNTEELVNDIKLPPRCQNYLYVDCYSLVSGRKLKMIRFYLGQGFGFMNNADINLKVEGNLFSISIFRDQY